ncbi:uncharacterized protein LOC119402223 isoform X2 [Rhipicephalus sanguineus]|uniref:uncharacterized protein LOC119402223 isoform X2 n=1 Tax=Rhipicephalus sanguineus TaxID=34632 RepID=UPI0020C53443|nr:uncharacterized protein LOC119402223 isoform X2 [Rhipicephalus sanguineus]
MATLVLVVIMSFLSFEALARNFCSYPTEEEFFCTYVGQPYERLCPTLTKVCEHIGEKMCMCKPGYYRRRFWYPCVPYEKCVLPKHTDFKILGSGELLYLTKASGNVFYSNLVKCFNSSFERGGLATWYRRLQYQKRSGEITEEGFVPTTEWETVEGKLALEVVIDEKNGGRKYVLRTNAFGDPPPGAASNYTVMHAEANCIIIILQEHRDGERDRSRRMAMLYYAPLLTLLSSVSAATIACTKPHEMVYNCSYKGEPYERLCPDIIRRWCHYEGQQVCLCKMAHFRRLYDSECVHLRDCAKREVKHIMLACFRDDVYLVGVSRTVFRSKRTKCVRLLLNDVTKTGCRRVAMVKERSWKIDSNDFGDSEEEKGPLSNWERKITSPA